MHIKKEIVQISKQCIKKRPPLWRAFFCGMRAPAPIFLRFLMRQPFAGTYFCRTRRVGTYFCGAPDGAYFYDARPAALISVKHLFRSRAGSPRRRSAVHLAPARCICQRICQKTTLSGDFGASLLYTGHSCS